MKAYAVMDSDGELVAVSESVELAIEAAQEEAAGGTVYFDGPGEDLGAEPPGAAVEMAANPIPLLTAKAMRSSGLRAYDFGQIMEMPKEEAWERILPFFPTRRSSGRRLKSYRTPVDMSSRILGQNYKTEKKTPRDVRMLLRERTGFSEAKVMGLSLLPHTQVFNAKAPGGADVQDILAHAKRFGLPVIDVPKPNACIRATPECMASCLVFSGRNLTDDYNTIKKFALMQALWGDTPAFLRMLGEAIDRHVNGCKRTHSMPLVRLNVFSDLPWELIVPDLFSYYSKRGSKSQRRDFVQFYDYTKIPGRKVPDNYDITFSYAGTEENVGGMEDERDRGRRIAVVFALVGNRRVKGLGNVPIPKKPPAGKRGFPSRWADLQVVDGDKSDLRPYDPAPSIVALRWKPPANQGVSLVKAGAFIVRGRIEDGQFICAETPTRTLDYVGKFDDEDEEDE